MDKQELTPSTLMFCVWLDCKEIVYYALKPRGETSE